MKIKAGIIGATGYAGVELLRLLLSHPEVELAAISSMSYAGKPISEVYPNLAHALNQTLCTDEEVLARAEVVFASLPHGHSERYAAACAAQHQIFIDLGADFRLREESDYQQWYGLEYHEPSLHREAVYALPELYREQIRGKKILGNPGCYPTSIALGLYPALKNKLIDPHSIIIDSKSGVTGAGRSPTQNTHYPDCNEAFSPYKIAEHRHTPEIEQTLSDLAGESLTVTFVPHLLPVNRGILSTMYATLTAQTTLEEIHAQYEQAYRDEIFVRICPLGTAANLGRVRLSNYCDVSLHLDARTNRLIVVSALDNMIKGAAGQAIQNMNLVCGLPEGTGLMMVPPAF